MTEVEGTTLNNDNGNEYNDPAKNDNTVIKKNTKKRARRGGKRKNKQNKNQTHTNDDADAEQLNLEVEYITGETDLAEKDPNFDHFQNIFSKFLSAEELTKEEEKVEEPSLSEQELLKKQEEEMLFGDDEEQDDEVKTTSKKKLKKAKRMEVAALKHCVSRPDVVEVHDVTADDPKLLVYLKSYRNTVPVPRHWSQKRKYLQGKRGIEKPPFRLPEFIRNTGITALREGAADKDAEKTSKAKQRERVQPKMGRIDIDYQILRDAFFKYQTKPPMTISGDLYYENKEHEVKFNTHFKPGKLSDKLRLALGMPPGAPPPWLINMQKYGVPPSYPKLCIPGLNAPIPEGASYGYHPGGWGRLPVDAFNKPLYTDFFISDQEKNSQQQKEKQDDMHRATHVDFWGQIEQVPEEEEQEEEQVEEQEQTTQEAAPTPSKNEKKQTKQQSVPVATTAAVPITSSRSIETPDVIDLRKRAAAAEAPKVLYQIAEQKQTPIGQNDIMGSSYQYVLPPSSTVAPAAVSQDDANGVREVFDEESKKRKRKDDKDTKKKKFKF
ncbi:splicing factor 3B subunit 2 [Acrasis kona]|uniref:Splicing factor 3B subunit 2 n=1 Tax=Acrasis kona TaxID=1008807 RepID=A0AAW2Z589_9EUKA